MRQTSPKNLTNHDLSSIQDQLTECGGVQSTEKLDIEGSRLPEITDV